MERDPLPPPPSKRLVKTALHQAILDERLHQVRLLVDKHRANIDCKDVHGRTPLMLTCIIDNSGLGFKMAYILVKAGADPNARDGMGRTALSYACMNGRESLVRLILKEDALNLNETDSDSNTCLHHAALGGNLPIVRMLAQAFHKYGLSPDHRNNRGYTPLLIACKSGHYMAAYTILTIAKASPALRDSEFHQNAAEWTKRGLRLNAPVSGRMFTASAPASLPRPLASLSFERDGTMYQKPWVPVCRVYRSANPYCTVDGLRLPVITKTTEADAKGSEAVMDNEEARQLLLDEINKAELKSGTQGAKNSPPPRWMHPSTAKLRAASYRGAKASSVPDMVAMFKIYSEQYQPDWRKRVPKTAASDLGTSVSCVVP
ncbi:unnamed protein product [Lymnaea stagnalis]|uniref:Ankyrin repeat protein n=1 Tax=Lymnaea stagnalis TaxID=6523 RepID=A0AAV2IGM8_LYMST